MSKGLQDFLTFMFFMDLDVDRVDALLNIIPGEELLATGESLSSLFDECVGIPEGQRHGRCQQFCDIKRSHTVVAT